MNDDVWSIQTWSFEDHSVGYGYVTSNHPGAPQGDLPWHAYLAPLYFHRESAFDRWFATAEEAKAALNAHADQIRAARDAEARA